MSKGLEYVRSELELGEDCLTSHDRCGLKQVEKELKDNNRLIEILKTCKIENSSKIDLSKLRLDEYIFVIQKLGKTPKFKGVLCDD